MPNITQNQQLEIIYQDQYYVAINKPPALLVHRTIIDKHETKFAVQILAEQINQPVYPIHRLDKATSGILLFALSPEILRKTNKIFAERKIEKQYLAIVRGYTNKTDTINYPLPQVKDKILKNTNQQKRLEAITQYSRIATIELPIHIDKYPTTRYSLIKLTPKTGRRHQLRLHMKHIAHPIIGDTQYGKTTHNNYFRNQLNCHRLLLAATQLKFIHPITNHTINLSQPPKDSFQQIIEKFNWQHQPTTIV